MEQIDWVSKVRSERPMIHVAVVFGTSGRLCQELVVVMSEMDRKWTPKVEDVLRVTSDSCF